MNKFLKLLTTTDNFYEKIAGLIKMIAVFGEGETAVIAGIYNAILPAASAIIVAIALYEILKTVITKGQDVTVQMFLPPFIKVAFCFFIISKGGTLIGKILGTSNYFVGEGVSAISSATSLVTEALEEFRDDYTGSMTGKILLFGIGLAVGFIAQTKASLTIIKELIVTKLEIIIRLAFTPFAVANLCTHEHHGGVAYIKSLLVRGFYMYLIIASVYLIKVCTTNLAIESMALVDMAGWREEGLSYIPHFLIMSWVGPGCMVKLSKMARRFIDEALG